MPALTKNCKLYGFDIIKSPANNISRKIQVGTLLCKTSSIITLLSNAKSQNAVLRAFYVSYMEHFSLFIPRSMFQSNRHRLVCKYAERSPQFQDMLPQIRATTIIKKIKSNVSTFLDDNKNECYSAL